MGISLKADSADRRRGRTVANSLATEIDSSSADFQFKIGCRSETISAVELSLAHRILEILVIGHQFQF